MEPLDHYAERRARELHAQGVPASEAIDRIVRESKEDARELRDELILREPASVTASTQARSRLLPSPDGWRSPR